MKKMLGCLGAITLAAVSLLTSCSHNLLLDQEDFTQSSSRAAAQSDLTIHVKASNAPSIWVWEENGNAISEKMGYTWDSQPYMTQAYDMNDNNGWYSYTVSSSYLTGKTIDFILNKGETIQSGKSASFYYDNGSLYDNDPSSKGLSIYVKASSAPSIWVWEENGTAISEKMGYTWDNQPYMSSDSNGLYRFDIGSSYLTGKTIDFILNKGDTLKSGKTSTFYYVDGVFYDSYGSSSDLYIYIKAASAPTIWVWENEGTAISEKMGYTWDSQPAMTQATNMYDNNGWYVFKCTGSLLTGKEICYILNKGETKNTGKTATFYCETENVYSDTDPTIPQEPVAPSVTISPSDTAFTTSNITVTFKDGNDLDNFTAAVTIENVTYTYGKDFTSLTFTKNISADLGITEETTLNVSAKCSNSIQSNVTASASIKVTKPVVVKDTFTWDNALVYFVLTDRFYNGDSSNDHSYYRKNSQSDSRIPDVATFHGGDIKGLTQKLDYLEDLGVNAIWITAPYEQIHGWTDGKDSKFPHYGFHGYYALDWTMMDKNMGTVEEFRNFVTEAHRRGIRIVMDIVINHAGYENTQDMLDYNFGSFKNGNPGNGWCPVTENSWTKETYINEKDVNASGWERWWYKWTRCFGGRYGYPQPGSGNMASVYDLPDIVTEVEYHLDLPVFLKTKWNVESQYGSKADEYEPWRIKAADEYRKNISSFSPRNYIEHWLASWVREFGIDGFRCDTVNDCDHVAFKELKNLCTQALKDWRNDSSRVDPYAAAWDENFWMVAEAYGNKNISGSDKLYKDGGFDSLLNFSFMDNCGAAGTEPKVSDWQNYANSINSQSNDEDENGNKNNVLTYVSSHDTNLLRPGDMYTLATEFVLLPGGVQIFYGDESSRQKVDGKGDVSMETRGDMNFGSNTSLVKHWGKIGTFRKFNPAVGAGSQTVKGSTYQRKYSGNTGSNNIAISVSSSTVDVSGLYANGTVVYDWYTGKQATVSNGSAAFSTSVSTSRPLLVSDRNPADYGVNF